MDSRHKINIYQIIHKFFINLKKNTNGAREGATQMVDGRELHLRPRQDRPPGTPPMPWRAALTPGTAAPAPWTAAPAPWA